MADISITQPDGTVRAFPLEDRPVTLGRGTTTELSFPDDIGLSRQHLVFEREGGSWTIRDLGSKNGTILNGQRLEGKRTLQPGDKVVASRVTIVFGKTAPPPPQTVYFDPGTQTSGSTLQTSLKEVLSSKPDTGAPGKPASSAKHWVSPVQALLRAGRELAQRRPLEELFPVILNLALEAVNADRGVLLTMEADRLVVKASSAGEFHISTAVRDRVIAEHSSLLIQNVNQDAALLARQSIVMGGVQSLMAVPLQTDERVIGLLYVDSLSFFRKFTVEDLSLLTVMANVAAIRIERERLALVEEAEKTHLLELSQAAEIQQRHLPTKPPQMEGLELAGMNVPCKGVGGDYFDYLEFPDKRLTLVVADVAGKGMPASLLMMNLQARAQALAETANQISDYVASLNRSICKTCPANRFITLLACAINRETGEMTYTNAGHNVGLLLRKDGRLELLEEGGPVLGLIPRVPYDEGRVQLERGDLLLLYSDGISECESPAGEDFGTDRLGELMRLHQGSSAEQLMIAIRDAVLDWGKGAPAADDCTLLVARRV